VSRPSVGVLGGTGQQGRGIAQRLARAGFAVTVGSRDPARAAAAIAEWPPDTRGVTSADYASVASAADTIVLAVPFDAVGPLLEEHAARVRPQSLVIDVTVPLNFAEGKVTLRDVAEGSAAEFIRARLPAHVRLAVAFKTLPAHLLNDVDRPLDCDEFVCADSPEARAAATGLVEAMPGLRAVDLGPLSRARSIEHLTLLAVAVNRRHKIRDARYRIVGI
jgi:NADPH-dependent F420 reductase